MQIMLEIGIFILGLILVISTIFAVIRTFVLPRGENVLLESVVFAVLYKVFHLRSKWAKNPDGKERTWALLAPIMLLILPIVWLSLLLTGFMGMFWAVGVRPWGAAFLLSGSSMLTLGFTPVNNMAETALAFSEATLGLILIALLIAYLPTMYGVFSKREAAVAKLETYAGIPPSAIELLARIHRINGYDYLDEIWASWETWFAEVEESHTTFGPMSFFRSPKPANSWITAAGTVLDAASLSLSILDMPFNPRAAICIRAGYIALNNIATFLRFVINTEPNADDPISVEREEFDNIYDILNGLGLPIKEDRNQAWVDFSGWRVNYDEALMALAAFVHAPKAHWSSDRAILGNYQRKNVFQRK